MNRYPHYHTTISDQLNRPEEFTNPTEPNPTTITKARSLRSLHNTQQAIQQHTNQTHPKHTITLEHNGHTIQYNPDLGIAQTTDPDGNTTTYYTELHTQITPIPQNILDDLKTLYPQLA